MSQFEKIFLQVGRACEASVDADEIQEAFYYHKATDTMVALSLSKAHVEVKRAVELLATRLVELEQAAIRLQGKEAA